MTPPQSNAAGMGASGGYRLPPADVVAILDTPPPPVAVLSPDRTTLLLADYEAYPGIAELARPFLKLGGLRIDPRRGGLQQVSHYTGFTFVSVADGSRRPLTGLPPGAKLGAPAWSLDGKRFAFTRDIDDERGMEVWLADVETASCHALPGVRVSDVLAGPFLWMDDSRHLIAVLIPTERTSAPAPPLVPTGPVIESTAGKKTRAATYQDLLGSTYDEELFTYYSATRLARIDTETGAVTLLGDAPDLFLSIRLSPNEQYMLVTRLKRPFSYRVPYFYFARTTEVWEAATGRPVYTVSDLPVSDEVPPQGVPLGPRTVYWQEKKPATLLWAEALDGGDPLAKVPHRDRILTISAPFDSEPREVLKITHRFSGWDWLDREDDVFLAEYDRDRRWRTTYRLDLKDPEGTRKVVFDLSVNDAYGDPGEPIYETKPDGTRVVLEDYSHIYLAGAGATPAGNRPFLDRMDLATGEKERLFRSPDNSYEQFLAFLDPTDRERKTLLIARQSRTEPRNLYVHDRPTGARRALTAFPDPHPQITGLHKEIVRYTREMDGAPLSGTLYLPPGYDPASGEKLPLLIWAYPEEYSDAATAGQVRGSDVTFTRLASTSPLWFVTQGWAVLDNAAMPVVGDPETMNDTFVEQIVGAAKAAIDAIDARGLIDRARVVVGGHSYGAFMTANLLAHSDLFAAGIARSGAYNRTLTPWGFQSERRSYWEARDIYAKLSPFTWADKIKAPILLIHGQADNNSGTFPIQSERLYQALQGTGGTARLVLLPHESHGYRARESVLHVLAEMFEWAEMHTR